MGILRSSERLRELGSQSDPPRFLRESAIPDSAVLQYDATQLSGLSDGDTVSTLTDSVNGYDGSAIGGPTYKTGIQNGNPVVRYDGVDDGHAADLSFSQPFTSLTVIANPNPDDTVQRVWGYENSSDNDVDVYWSDDTAGWSSFAGDPILSKDTTTASLILTVIFDGSDGRLRVNGTQVTAKSVGTSDIQGIQMASDADGRYLDFDLGEQVLYNADLEATGDLASEEQRVSDKWGISI